MDRRQAGGVDFEGINNVTAVLLNSAISRLYREFDTQLVGPWVRIVKGSADIESMIDIAVASAKEYSTDRTRVEARDAYLMREDYAWLRRYIRTTSRRGALRT